MRLIPGINQTSPNNTQAAASRTPTKPNHHFPKVITSTPGFKIFKKWKTQVLQQGSWIKKPISTQ
jgi:hypothetical protein